MELRGSSREESVLCPVHSEDRPSVTVNVEEGVFFCFSCQAKGTAINLIMAMENCTRAEALERAEKLAAAAGMTSQRPSRRYQRPGEGRAQTSGKRYIRPGGRRT